MLPSYDMPDPLPHHYSASLRRTRTPRPHVEDPRGTELHGGRSLVFDKDVRVQSPEHMLLTSLGLCMLATLEQIAERDGIEILTCDAKIGGTVEETSEGPMFTSIVLELDMALAGNIDLVENTLEDAKQYCVVQNSLRAPVVIETLLRTPDELPPELQPLAPHGTLDRHHAS
ncbi:MAG TPA: OsmC family protein [Kofleriaceae bacterium]|nr:OsmC family protein [Kofleriaceae bacterium]